MPATASILEPDDLLGRTLSSFRILEPLGRGAMGRVYTATHEVLGRRVAVKVLEPKFAEDPDTLERFVDEARAANSIRHPNIIDIQDFGQLDGRPYYVMELLEGETLGERLARAGSLTPKAAVRVAIQVASALAAAHDRGVIHRDLKPDNIFLCVHPDYPDRVKVLDFGIAKLLDPSHVAGRRRPTGRGIVMGTPLYMSPEQCRGEEVDARSDVYALAVVLFEALTGRAPFERRDWADVLLAHVQDAPPSPRDLDPALPEALETIILRGLAKEPDERFADMRNMRAALIAFERSVQTSVLPQRPAAPAAAPATPATRVHGPDTIHRLGSNVAAALERILLRRIDRDRLVLPVIPHSIGAVLEELARPEPDLVKIANRVGADPLLAPQVLRLAGSALHGATRPRTVLQAAMRLGLVRLRTVMIELSAHRAFDSKRPQVNEMFAGLWEHSVAVAVLARQVCRALGDPVDPEIVHVGGLLHDVGKPLVGVMLLEAEKALRGDFALDAESWLGVVERAHRRVAVRLASAWQLGTELQHIVAGCGSYREGGARVAANIVCFANALAKSAGKTVGHVDTEQVNELVAEGAERLGLDWRLVPELRACLDDLLAAYAPEPPGAEAATAPLGPSGKKTAAP